MTSPTSHSASPSTSPARLSAWEGVARQASYWWTVQKRTWRGEVASSFLSPLLYVVGLGVLLGRFIEGDPARLEGASSYLAFIVPGLVAAHAMQLAVNETTYPVMGGIKWRRTYLAQMATPLRLRDIVNAHLLFALFRVALACAVFMVVLAAFGIFRTWWGPPLAWLTQILVGAAFATVVYGVSARLRSEEGFGLIFRLGVIPLLLFSGAFFPVDNLGPVLAWVARLTPLWHGVDLSRMLCLDTVEPGPALLHVVVLVTVTALGWWWAVRGLEQRLGER